MKTFTSLYKVPVRAGDSLFTLLHESIKLLLPMLEEQEQLRILSTRVKLKEQMDDDVAWGGAEMQEVAEEGDLDELEKLEKKEKDVVVVVLL